MLASSQEALSLCVSTTDGHPFSHLSEPSTRVSEAAKEVSTPSAKCRLISRRLAVGQSIPTHILSHSLCPASAHIGAFKKQ